MKAPEKRLQDWCENYEKKSLYDLVGVPEPHPVDGKELLEGIKKKRASWRSRADKAGVMDLLDLALEVLRESGGKARYDRLVLAQPEPETLLVNPQDGDRGSERERSPDETALAFIRGRVARGDAVGAAEEAKRLVGEFPEYSHLRTTIARNLFADGLYRDLVDFLHWCESQESDNPDYGRLLGFGYARRGTATWDHWPDGSPFATRADQLAEAEACLRQGRAYADRLSGRDADLDAELAQLRLHIHHEQESKWNGNVVAVVGAFVLGLLWLGGAGVSPFALAMFHGMGLLMWSSAAVYSLSSWGPRWQSRRSYQQGGGVGCSGYFVEGLVLLAVLPLVAAWKFCTSFLPNYRKRASISRAGRDWPGFAGGRWRSLGLPARVIAVVVGLAVLDFVAGFPFGTRSRSPAESDVSTVAPTGGLAESASAVAGESGVSSGAAARETVIAPPRSGASGQAAGGTTGGTTVVAPSAAPPAPAAAPNAPGSRPAAAPAPPAPSRNSPTATAGQPEATTTAAPLVEAVEPARSDPPPLVEPVRIGGNVPRPPKIWNVTPEYPRLARLRRIQGIVILEVTVDRQGAVSNVSVLRSVEGLDEAAVEAVRQWRYEPTIVNGSAVSVVFTETVRFQI